MRLHELQREMTQETKSLELELQDEPGSPSRKEMLIFFEGLIWLRKNAIAHGLQCFDRGMQNIPPLPLYCRDSGIVPL